MKQNLSVGKLGEDIACEYLISKKFTIRERNHLRKWGEIDIVAEKGGKTHFVEVKAVSCESVPYETEMRPEDNMHESKILRLKRVVQTYMVKDPQADWQFDVIALWINKDSRRVFVKYLKNIIL